MDKFVRDRNRAVAHMHAEVSKVYSDEQIQSIVRQAVEQERKRCLGAIEQIMLNDDFRSGVDACAQIKRAIEKGEHG